MHVDLATDPWAHCRWLADRLRRRLAPSHRHGPLACFLLLMLALALACLLLLALACLLLGSLRLFAGLHRLIAHWNMRSRSTGLLWAHRRYLGTVLMHAHVTGSSAMGPQAVSGRFESDWHADGLNVQPDGLNGSEWLKKRLLGLGRNNWDPRQ